MDGSLVWKNQHHQSGTLMPLGAVHPVIASAAKQSISQRRKCGLLRYARNDAARDHTSAFSRRENARVLQESFGPKQRAQGLPGARCTRSLACKKSKAHEVVTTGAPEQPGIPRARVL